MLDLLHLGPETSDSVHRVRMYLHFALLHPQGSDLRRMWMACAFSQNFGVCPHCVPAYQEEQREFRDWAIRRTVSKSTSRWADLPLQWKRTCKTPGCANNKDEASAKLRNMVQPPPLRDAQIVRQHARLASWI